MDRVQAYVDDLVLRLRARRERLGDPGHSLTVEQARGFNAAREHALEEYRGGLHRLNRAIMFHNLGVPEGLHRRPVLIDDAVERLADEIPLLKEPPAPVRLPWQSRLAARLKRLL